MGDGVVNKYALIINGGEGDERFFNAVDLSLEVLESGGYETYVTSSREPQHECDHYATSTLGNIRQFIEEIKGRIDDDDELVIYVEGHGVQNAMCLPDGCYPDLAGFLDIGTYGQRTELLTQCYNGNFNNIFYDNPRNLFMAAGSRGEIVDGDFGMNFWAPNVPDLNGDGVINWQERFANAARGRYDSFPQFIISDGYILEGNPPFSTDVRSVENISELDEVVNELNEGQYAVLNFSPAWCPHCREYEPQYQQLALETGGQYLFLRTGSEEIAEKYGISEFPTLMMLNNRGGVYEIPYKNRPFGLVGLFYETEEDRLELSRQQLSNPDPIVRICSANTVYELASNTGRLNSQLADEIARVYRGLFTDTNISNVTRWTAASYYGDLAGSLSSEEAQEGARALRELFDDPDVQVSFNSINAYRSISVDLGSDELQVAIDALQMLIDHPPHIRIRQAAIQTRDALVVKLRTE